MFNTKKTRFTILSLNSGLYLFYMVMIFAGSDNETILEFTPSYSVDYCKVAKETYAIQLNNYTYLLKFKTHIGNIHFDKLNCRFLIL